MSKKNYYQNAGSVAMKKNKMSINLEADSTDIMIVRTIKYNLLDDLKIVLAKFQDKDFKIKSIYFHEES